MPTIVGTWKLVGAKARDRDPQKRRELVRAEALVQREIGSLEMNHPGAPPRAHALSDVPKLKDYPVLLRGEVQNTGVIVPRRPGRLKWLFADLFA